MKDLQFLCVCSQYPIFLLLSCVFASVSVLISRKNEKTQDLETKTKELTSSLRDLEKECESLREQISCLRSDLDTREQDLMEKVCCSDLLTFLSERLIYSFLRCEISICCFPLLNE